MQGLHIQSFLCWTHCSPRAPFFQGRIKSYLARRKGSIGRSAFLKRWKNLIRLMEQDFHSIERYLTFMGVIIRRLWKYCNRIVLLGNG